jgi:2-polyprenyl-6-methoxyphenol hydroxylase-like FAD-dependent oxidoreductase
VFLAGDAVHLVIPAGGLGMNTGVGDAFDLSWKLAATLEGWGGPELLDSYEVERRQVGERNIGASRYATLGYRNGARNGVRKSVTTVRLGDLLATTLRRLPTSNSAK